MKNKTQQKAAEAERKGDYITALPLWRKAMVKNARNKPEHDWCRARLMWCQKVLNIDPKSWGT